MLRLFIKFVTIALFALTAVTVRAAAPEEGVAAPASLTQIAAGTTVPAGAWTNQTVVEVRFQAAGTGTTLTPEVEWRSSSTPFAGQPTHRGAAVQSEAGTITGFTVRITGLKQAGAYRWQARVTDESGAPSAWVPFTVAPAGGAAIRIDTAAPSAPAVTSSTIRQQGVTYRTRRVQFSWRSVDAVAGVAGYSWALDHRSTGAPGQLRDQTSMAFPNLADGTWVLHVWAQDRAGNWGPGSTFRFALDRTAPVIIPVSTSTHIFNPYIGDVTWRFSLSERSRVTVDIRRSGQSAPVLVRDLGLLSSGAHLFSWNGRTAAGALSPADWHWFHVTATDPGGNRANRAFGGIHVRPELVKRIVISLSQQSIDAYEGNRVVLHSLATTGNWAMTPTPAGHYAIFAKYSPFQFVSPWPPGHPFWYASAWSSYAMEFISGGYFIHDAPWRSVFGPTSQGGGMPGTDYGGTHGCVNVPPSTAEFLFGWAPMGTAVDVVG